MHHRKPKRQGALTVEMAFILPVLLMLMFGFYEFGRIHMIKNMLNIAARNGARYGSTDGSTNAEVETRVRNYLAPVVSQDAVTLIVKDASAFDGDNLPSTQEEYEALSEINLSTAESRQRFLVRARLRYNDVAIMNLPWLGEMHLIGQSVTRHE